MLERIFFKPILSLLATGLYLGKIPVAPGTWGSALGLFLGFVLLRYYGFFWFFWSFLAILMCSFYIIHFFAQKYKKDMDSPEIVIDEVVGMMISMAPLGSSSVEVALEEGGTHVLPLLAILPIQYAIAASFVSFLLFRFFDILKPWPIHVLDNKIHSAFGTVIDDVVAGIFAAIVLIGIAYTGLQLL